jgi:hypothetical protein
MFVGDMRKKTTKKLKNRFPMKTLQRVDVLGSGTNAANSPTADVSHAVNVVYVQAPPPEVLLEEAEQEPNYRDLRSYCQVIRTLRGKGFSYRDIAEWLSERGVDADHNAVYRVYTNSLSDSEARMEDEEEELEARMEAERNR